MNEQDTPVIDTRSLVEKVYEYLVNQIKEGKFKYGQIISTKEIAQRLNVSTMPVREAIKRLKYEQIIDIKPQSKCKIKEPSKKMIMEIYELREVLETYALTKGLKNFDGQRLDKLRSIVEEMKKVKDEKHPVEEEKRAIALDSQFHTEIWSMADNDYMNDLYRQLSLHVNMTIIHEKTYQILRDQNKYYESHAEIVDRLSSYPRAAVKALREHFKNVVNQLFKGENSTT